MADSYFLNINIFVKGRNKARFKGYFVQKAAIGFDIMMEPAE